MYKSVQHQLRVKRRVQRELRLRVFTYGILAWALAGAILVAYEFYLLAQILNLLQRF